MQLEDRLVPKAPPIARYGTAALVACLTVYAFLPALEGQFVNWDDDRILVEQYGYRSFSPAHLRWMFDTTYMGHYQPFTWLSYAMDFQIHGGLDPWGFHLTNLIFHTANALLFYILCLAMLSRVSRQERVAASVRYLSAGVAALFFGVHPLRVESVAWVTERRDVVSTFFLLICLLCYHRHATTNSQGLRNRAYGLAVVFFVLSLMSKAWGITLPLVLMVLDFYPYRRFCRPVNEQDVKTRRQVLVEKTPFLVAAVSAGIIALKAQVAGGDVHSLAEHGLADRALQASYGLFFYIQKTLLPVALSPLYELPPKMSWSDVRYLIPCVFGLVFAATTFLMRGRAPQVTACACIYIFVLAPVLGCAQSGPQLVADRYSYLACMPWAVLFAGVICRCRKQNRAALLLLGCVVASAWLIATTRQQCRVWRSSQSLWEHVLRINPRSWHAHMNLGATWQEQGELARASNLYLEAIQIKPDLPEAHANAVASAALGDSEQAMRRAMQAERLVRDEVQVYVTLASTYDRIREWEAAERVIRRALLLHPADADNLYRLVRVLRQLGRNQEAVGALSEAIDAIDANEIATARRNADPEFNRRYVAACGELAAHYHRSGDKALSSWYRMKLNSQSR